MAPVVPPGVSVFHKRILFFSGSRARATSRENESILREGGASVPGPDTSAHPDQAGNARTYSPSVLQDGHRWRGNGITRRGIEPG